MSSPENRRGHLDQARVTAIYDRNARLYDAMEAPVERAAFERLRPRLFGDLHGRVLELGIGTGKNLHHAPRTGALQLVAIDPSSAMLERARRRASDLGVAIELVQAAAQDLPFPEATFDAVIASFVLCSVAEPVAGLREAYRVLKPGGSMRVLEHQRPATAALAPLFDLVNPIVVRVAGANINRETEQNIARAGFQVTRSEHIDRFGILRLIEARRP